MGLVAKDLPSPDSQAVIRQLFTGVEILQIDRGDSNGNTRVDIVRIRAKQGKFLLNIRFTKRGNSWDATVRI